MKHINRLMLTAVALFSALLLQAQARDASVVIDKQNRNAVMIAIPQPEKITREALALRMERSGLKEKNKKGITRYKGVTLSEISPEMVDIYTKVEEGPNNTSVVYMAVSKGYDNFTSQEMDSSITHHVKTFLDSLVQDVDNHLADEAIGAQINEMEKDEKMYQRLLNEQKDLRKKKLEVESRLNAIEKELTERNEERDQKRMAVEDAKAKRGTVKQ